MHTKFVGRWVPSGNSMTTGYPGSSFTFKVSGTHNVTIVTTGARRVAYRIDDGSYVKSTSATVSITGLTLSTHTIKVVLTTSTSTWTGTNYATVSSITVDQGGEIVTTNLAKRRLLVFGDSITEGWMYVNSESVTTSASELTYWNKLGDMLGADMIPSGFGGIGYVTNANGNYPMLSANPSYIENVSSTLINADTDFDIILILLGVNDGKSTSVVDNDYVTVVNGCITRIKAKYPSADIHALIPFNNNGKPSLEQVYNAQGVHIIPQTWYSQITFGDSLHPNDNGHTVIANNLKSYFENYYGSAYFKEVTMKRIDTIYIDTNGAVQKVTGTMANNPVKPTLPTGAIKVADVVVEQGANTGTIVDKRDWLKKYDNLSIVNVKDYGAKGDGVTDDTAAIQSAIDNNPESLIYIPTGQYKITSTIKVIAPIVGDGYMRDVQNKKNGTWIINDSEGYAFKINSSSNLNLFISRLSIYCNNDNGGIYADMDKHNLYHFEELGIFNVATYGMNICSTVGSSREVFMRDITIFGSRERKYYENTAIYLDGNSYDSRLTNIEIMATQIGIVGTGPLYGTNWHIWLGDMFGKTNKQWWLHTRAITFKGSLEVTNLYIDSARCGIAASGGIIIVSNLIWMNDESMAVDDTSDRAEGFLLWNDQDNTSRPITGALTNCELHLSPHANLPFINTGCYETLKVSNVAVDLRNTNYESLALTHTGKINSLFLPNSSVYDVEYSIENVHPNAANLILIGKIVTHSGLYGVAEMKLQMDSVYVGSIFIRTANGAYAGSRVETKFGEGFHFYISSFKNGIASIYAKYPNTIGMACGSIKCPKARNVGFLDLNATIRGNKYDFTTNVTDISKLTELGV